MSGTVRFGTSSWSAKSWDGVFYPAGTRPADRIQYYATQFTTVEADVTYYRVPTASMVMNWKRKTPDSFIFSAKFPGSIVHGGAGKTPDPQKLLIKEHVWEDTMKFLDVMSQLESRLGPLILQFPYLNRNVFDTPDRFFERLDDFLSCLPKGFRFAVETRNKNYLKPAFYQVLKKHETPMVFVDLPYMPAPDYLDDIAVEAAGNFTYVRLVGDRKAVNDLTDSFDRIVIDRSKRLDSWAGFLNNCSARVNEIFVYANNHFAGHGPATILELIRRMESARAKGE